MCLIKYFILFWRLASIDPKYTLSTCNVYTDIESLPDDMRQRLEPFSKESKCSARDKLNIVQRAFFKYKVGELKKTGHKLDDTFINGMIQEGVNERVWKKDFKPSPDVTFFQYIHYRIKNEKKIIARELLLKSTMMMMSSGLTTHQPMRVICVKMVN